MGIIKAFKLGFDYLKYDEDGNVEATQRAVNDVNLDIEAGDFVAVLGHNGSGKSTLAKQINALLIPSEGTMWVDDMGHSQGAGAVENPPESGDGFSESGQPDHWYGCGRGCRLWS